MLRLDDVHVHIGKLHILQGVHLKVDFASAYVRSEERTLRR